MKKMIYIAILIAICIIAIVGIKMGIILPTTENTKKILVIMIVVTIIGIIRCRNRA